MAPTPLNVEVSHPLVAAAQKVPAQRHRRLLKYLNRLVARTCPSYLQNDRDDIVQTALIRLDGKLGEVRNHLETCLVLIRDDREAGRLELADVLRECLREIDKSWDRKRSEKIRSKLAKCASWAAGTENGIGVKEARKLMADSLDWLSKKGGKEIFSEAYVKRGLQWAIMDSRKKFLGDPEVSLEEKEGGSLEGDVSSGKLSWQRSLILREEIADCLQGLVETKRFPTYLALIGYEYREIAEYLDLSVPQTDSRIRRGKAFLRNCLKLKGVFP